jgi:3',5'-cyclic AMP phosphodiesterase CpdA
LINKTGDAVQLAEYKRITAQIDAAIPVYAVAGNHDVGNQPTPESIAAYRRTVGPDYYSFQRANIYGIVLDASLLGAPARAQTLATEQEEWLKQELVKAQASGARHIVVFQHQSFFLEKPDEPAQYYNIPLEPRRHYLDLLKAGGVRYVFAGHYHRNALGRDGQLEMITTGAVGRPNAPDPSGLRIVTIGEEALPHTFYSLGNIPNSFPPRAVARQP